MKPVCAIVAGAGTGVLCTELIVHVSLAAGIAAAVALVGVYFRATVL
jgi:hypothetical protein